MIPKELVFLPFSEIPASKVPENCWVLIHDPFDFPYIFVIQAKYSMDKFIDFKGNRIHPNLIRGICPIDKKAFDVEKCTVAELSSARRNLENELRDMICNSGLPISSVSVPLQECTTLSDTARRYVCSGVNIELSV